MTSSRRSTARCTAAPCARCSRSWPSTDRLLVTDGIALEAPKTKLLANQLKDGRSTNVLIVVEATDEKLYLAARNLPHVEVIEVTALNPLALAAYDKVLMTVAAVKLIEERLQ